MYRCVWRGGVAVSCHFKCSQFFVLFFNHHPPIVVVVVDFGKMQDNFAGSLTFTHWMLALH